MVKRFDRVVLKVSGESLSKPGELGIDPEELTLLAEEVADAYRKASPLQLAVVVGGGNIIRGARLAATGKVDQSTADYMGMLGTVINGLALKEALAHVGVEARVMSAINLPSVAEPFIRARALRHMEKGRVVKGTRFVDLADGETGQRVVTADSVRVAGDHVTTLLSEQLSPPLLLFRA